MIRALGVLKMASAKANRDLEQLPAEVSDLIEVAAQEVFLRKSKQATRLVLIHARC